MTTKSSTNLIWIDLEMTGLDTRRDEIIEIATVVTDSHLNILAEGPVIALHQPPRILRKMNDWNQRQHKKSGLIERVQNSRILLAEAENKTLAFLRTWVPRGKSPMCGNSICQDRRFLHRHMPLLEQYFHYRHLDVSTIKELVKRWYPDVAKKLNKKSTHLALDDIKASIDELKFYREEIFKKIAPKFL